MKIIETIILHGSQSHFSDAFDEIEAAIKSAQIVIPPIKKGNGVKPIKNETMQLLKNSGWSAEHKLDLEGMRAKPLDAYKHFANFRVGFEWETGNISSSFRALMKLYKSVIEKKTEVGVLVLPTREFYKYLTDRVGNVSEMLPYLDIYKRIQLPAKTCMAIIVVEYDKLDENQPPIPKGLDGMSKARRKKLKDQLSR